MQSFPFDVADVHGAVTIDGHAVRQQELPRFRPFLAPLRKNLARERHVKALIGATIGDEQCLVGGDAQTKRREAAVSPNKLSLLIEHLDSIVFPIGDVQ